MHDETTQDATQSSAQAERGAAAGAADDSTSGRPAWKHIQMCQEDVEEVIRRLSYVMAYSHLHGGETDWRMTRQLAPAVATLAAGADQLIDYLITIHKVPPDMGNDASTGTVDVPETDPDVDEPLSPHRGR